MRKKRGAIGLSLNFIIIIVISVAVLIFGFAFIKKLSTGATNIQEDYYRQFENSMEGLACDSTDRVCVGKNRKQVNRQGTAVFTLKVLNIGVDHSSGNDNFAVSVACSVGGGCGGVTASLAGTYEIAQNDGYKFPIAIPMSGVAKGTYTFNVQVYGDNGLGSLIEDYDKVQIHVVVP